LPGITVEAGDSMGSGATDEINSIKEQDISDGV
jgi:hypothetical protein